VALLALHGTVGTLVGVMWGWLVIRVVCPECGEAYSLRDGHECRGVGGARGGRRLGARADEEGVGMAEFRKVQDAVDALLLRVQVAEEKLGEVLGRLDALERVNSVGPKIAARRSAIAKRERAVVEDVGEPWVSLGLSRRTYYRKKARGEL